MHLTCAIALLFCIVMKIQAMERSSLYRNANGEFSVGDFRRSQYKYFWVAKLASSMVSDSLDCTFLCVGEPRCYSFNIAAFPDSGDLYLCELLPTGKYSAPDKLRSNATFHHYSPWVGFWIFPTQSVRSYFFRLTLIQFPFNFNSTVFSRICKTSLLTKR